ncbi:TonB-dependent receptor [Sphingobium sp. CR2-8]|uniref:TonB-dependent receptor n=1 Tax=Sphingobium sp. CR2-8 TaxID=1306534 RepID=UPI002DBFE856|nr:TonB-dependent receptor [Sphingobium sp. CR2-8]MEC3909619.1 TonB-dependent receptor [Sphingobium sp. CR2-8]
MIKLKKSRCLEGSLVSLAIALAAPASAQDVVQPPLPSTASVANDSQLEDIVVTAQRREENIQKIPIAVTAIGGAALANRGLDNLEQVKTVIPGLNLSSNNGVTLPFLRGIGNPGTALGNEASVGVYVDGIYYSRLPSGVFSLNNLSRIEVLKGPQGTLFGRNSSGGVIQLVTLDPSHVASMKGSIGYGNYDTFEANAYATTGLSETVAADISLSGRRQGEGYGKFVPTGNRTNYQDNFSVRSKILVTPSDLTSVALGGFYTYSKNNLAGNAFPGTRSGYSSQPNSQPLPIIGFYDQANDAISESYQKATTWGVSLTAEQEISFAALKSITAYMDTNAQMLADSDYTDRADGLATPSGHVRQFTQELQASSLSGSPVQWVGGLFYYNTVSAYDSRTRFFSPAGTIASLGGTTGFISLGRQHAKSYAAYGQATYEILPRLKVTGGLRYTIDRIDANGGLFRPDGTVFGPLREPGKFKTEKLTFRAAADYQFTDDVLGYVSFNRGFKSAVFALLTYNSTPAKPEQVDAYEVGLKGELFDRHVRFSLAAFHYNVKDPQVTITRAPTLILSNAGKSTVDGLEGDVQVRVMSGLTLRASAAYLDSKYKDFGQIINGVCVGCAPSGIPNPNAPFGATASAVVANGNQTPYVSKFTGSLGADYEFRTGIGTVLISTDYQHNSGFYSEPDNFLRQKPFDLLNGQVKISLNDNLALRVWGRNLLDKKYVDRISTNTTPAGYIYTPAAPITFGGAIDFKF